MAPLGPAISMVGSNAAYGDAGVWRAGMRGGLKTCVGSGRAFRAKPGIPSFLAGASDATALLIRVRRNLWNVNDLARSD